MFGSLAVIMHIPSNSRTFGSVSPHSTLHPRLFLPSFVIVCLHLDSKAIMRLVHGSSIRRDRWLTIRALVADCGVGGCLIRRILMGGTPNSFSPMNTFTCCVGAAYTAQCTLRQIELLVRMVWARMAPFDLQLFPGARRQGSLTGLGQTLWLFGELSC
jgi:hypothetical protein